MVIMSFSRDVKTKQKTKFCKGILSLDASPRAGSERNWRICEAIYFREGFTG